MGLYLPSIKYPPARPDEGFWNPITSTINWCEEDYYATIYSAEIINTLTNLLFIWLGVKGIRNCLRYGHDSIFVVSFCGYLLVGSGSFAFHSTLKCRGPRRLEDTATDSCADPMQLLDELSMIYTATIMCYATFSFSQSRAVRILLGVGLAGLAVFITVCTAPRARPNQSTDQSQLYYHYLQDPDFHQNAFALILIVIMARSTYVMEVNIRPTLKEKYGMKSRKSAASGPLTASERSANDRRDMEILRNMWLMVTLGLAIFLGGFGIWNLDNAFCSTIRRWRHQVGLPWGIVLEGHGWWHLMTGVGAYYYVVWAIWLRHCLNERQDEFVLSWPSIFSIPEVIPSAGAERKGSERTTDYVNDHANGYTSGNKNAKANGNNGHANIHGIREDRKSV
ncbi:hypothetical protein PZA11_004769 [Diplocarpon coronariae]